jgi:hypothetical protein
MEAQAQQQQPRYIQVVHVLPGRARLRLSWLRARPEEATAVADAVVACKGVNEVKVQPASCSLLCLYDPAAVDVEGIVRVLQEHTGVDQVITRGELPPAPTLSVPPRGIIAREVTSIFRDMNQGVLRATQGAMDLGTLVTGGFAAAGAVRILTQPQLPAPQWFNLAWWGFRTFLTFEKDAAAAESAEVPG